MADNNHNCANPLERLKSDIQALTKREGKSVRVVQVPLNRTTDIAGMNREKWREGSRGFLSDAEIGHLMAQVDESGPSGLSGLTFGETRILVAQRIEDDCSDLRIVDESTR